MRSISLTAVALLGAALLAPVGTAAASGETCQGQAATIVGTPGGQITGTEGADVIVTNDATRVDALGGDDLVCATGERSSYDSGTGTVTFAAAILGAGADTFIPSERSGYTIYAGTVDGTDTEADVIRLSWTAGLVISGMPGQPNADVIDVGDFGDVRWSGIQTAPGAVTASTGGTLGVLTVRSARGDVTMDASGTVTGVDTALTWTGRFNRLGFTTSAKYGRFTFRGTDHIERVKVNAPTTYDRDIALGGGHDSYESNSLGAKATRIKGGGRNALLLDLKSYDRVRVDLSRSRVTATKAGVEESVRVRGFYGLTVAAKRAVVIGTDRIDIIRVAACRTTIKGMKGGDELYVDYKLETYGAESLTMPRCSDYEATIDGGPGSDYLTGNYGDDRLIGGPGNDTVSGNKGRDVCQGETTRGCEKRI